MKPNLRASGRSHYAIIAFFVGFAFLLIGIYRGEVGVVLQKAINICLECIGIG